MYYLLLSVFTSPDAAESFGPLFTKAPTPVRRDEAGAPQHALALCNRRAESGDAMRVSYLCRRVVCDLGTTWR